MCNKLRARLESCMKRLMENGTEMLCIRELLGRLQGYNM